MRFEFALNQNNALSYSWVPSFDPVHLWRQASPYVAQGRIGAREFRLYVAVAPRLFAYLTGSSLRPPRHEVWVTTSLEMSLGLGVTLADAVMIGSGAKSGWGRLLGALTSGSLQRQFADRHGALERMDRLLRSPQVMSLLPEVGACSMGASDDTIILKLSGRLDPIRVRRACEITGQIADVLPELRRGLPPTPLESAAYALDRVAQARAAQRDDGLPFTIGPMPGGFVKIEIETGVWLGALGAFAPGPGGPLVHWMRGRQAALPRPFDSEAVRAALAALPAHTTAVCSGSRIQLSIEPRGQGASVVVNACFDFAHTLRVVALEDGRS